MDFNSFDKKSLIYRKLLIIFRFLKLIVLKKKEFPEMTNLDSLKLVLTLLENYDKKIINKVLSLSLKMIRKYIFFNILGIITSSYQENWKRKRFPKAFYSKKNMAFIIKY